MKMVMENPPPTPSTTLLHGKVWAQDLHKKLPIWIGGGGGGEGRVEVYLRISFEKEKVRFSPSRRVSK